MAAFIFSMAKKKKKSSKSAQQCFYTFIFPPFIFLAWTYAYELCRWKSVTHVRIIYLARYIHFTKHKSILNRWLNCCFFHLLTLSCEQQDVKYIMDQVPLHRETAGMQERRTLSHTWCCPRNMGTREWDTKRLRSELNSLLLWYTESVIPTFRSPERSGNFIMRKAWETRGKEEQPAS